MRALVVYESVFGSTRAVAEAIGDGLAATDRLEVQVVGVSSAPAAPDVQLLVVGGPVRGWVVSGAASGLRAYLVALPSRPKGTFAASFDTAAKSKWFPVVSAGKAGGYELTRAGYWIVVPPEHFLVEDALGTLARGEVDRARGWGARLAGITAM